MAMDGTYKVVVTTPMGPREATLNLKSDGTNLSGTFEDNMGKSEFSGGTINGNNLEWKAVAKTPMGPTTLNITVIIEGDTLKGQVVTPFGPSPIEGTRV